MAKRKWIEIPDCDVRHVWEMEDDDRCLVDTGSGPTLAKKRVVHVATTSYADSGIPVCEECGDNMTYVRTEIRLPMETI